MYFNKFGVSVEIDTSEVKWYWRYRWNDLLVALHLRERPATDPFAQVWSADSMLAFDAARTYGDMVDAALTNNSMYIIGDTISIPRADHLAVKTVEESC